MDYQGESYKDGELQRKELIDERNGEGHRKTRGFLQRSCGRENRRARQVSKIQNARLTL